MQTVLQDEDGSERNRRAQREAEQRRAEIARRDASVAPTEAERVAAAQLANQRFRRPLDYAAIIKFRAIEPGRFTLLPGDDVCRAALGLTGPDEVLTVVEGQRATLRLRK